MDAKLTAASVMDDLPRSVDRFGLSVLVSAGTARTGSDNIPATIRVRHDVPIGSLRLLVLELLRELTQLLDDQLSIEY